VVGEPLADLDQDVLGLVAVRAVWILVEEALELVRRVLRRRLVSCLK
jgi:hypothetical protein